MDLSQFTIVPAEPFDPEVAAAKARETMAANEQRARARQAAANRAAGIPQPRPGDVMYVGPGRGLKRRMRAGIPFEEGKRKAILVIDPDTFDGKLPDGHVSVTVHGAEEILGDDALAVHATSSADHEVAEERAARERAEQARERAEAENAKLKALLADARRNAPDPGDGSPGRLKAARAARAAAGRSDDGFGEG